MTNDPESTPALQSRGQDPGRDGALNAHPRFEHPSEDNADQASGSRAQATALILRARKLLADDSGGATLVHLQAALDALGDNGGLQVERDAIVRAELRHRFRNLVAVTQSLVTQTLRPGVTIEQARARLTDRLSAMAAAVDLLLGTKWQPSPLMAVIRSGLAHYTDHRERIECRGPEVMIGATSIISLTLALHELETNAIKHGALSVPEGRVNLSWSIVGEQSEPKLWLQWCEHSGPAVTPPRHKGFGTRLISDAVSRFLGAEVALEYTPQGVTWLLIVPLATIQT